MGLAGNGKSTVALSVLHDECVKPAFIVREGDFLVERRFWVRCDAFTSFAGLENHLCSRVFALSRQFGITDLMAVAEFFQNNKCLLILDNFETPADSDSGRMQHFFQALVGEAGVGSILVLAMRGYHAPRIDVKSVAFVRVVVDTLKEDKAAAMDTFCHFYEGARDPTNAAVTSKILSCLDHHPLCIRLFALRAKHDPSSSTAYLLELWRRQASAVLSENTDGRDGTPTLDMSLGFSLASPVIREQPGSFLALSFLSWSPDGLLRADLKDLLAGDYRAIDAILNVGLADDVPTMKRTSKRLRMLAPVRRHINELVLKQLPPFPPRVPESLQPLSNCLLLKAQKIVHQFEATKQRDALFELREEYMNFRQVVSDTLLHIVEMRGSIAVFLLENSNTLLYQGFDTTQLLRRILANEELSAPVSARLRLYLGKALGFRGYIKEALKELYASMSDSTDIENKADCLESMGRIDFQCGRNEEALQRFKEAEELYILTGSTLGRANCVQAMGDVDFRCRRNEEALRRFKEAEELYISTGSTLGRANCVQAMGDVDFRCRRNEEALRRFKEAEELFISTGSTFGRANCIKCIGDADFRCGRNEEALRRFKEAEELYILTGSTLGRANCVQAMGDVDFRCRRNEEALRRFKEAEELYILTG
ncbi:TPR-like protein, partial [Atractiella rhizophila]